MRADRDRVAAAFGIPATRLIGRSRIAEIVEARQAACWVLRKLWPAMSWPCIGILMGGRDHSTVIYGARQAEARRALCPEYRRRTDALARGRMPAAIEPAPASLVERLTRRLPETRREVDVLLALRPVKPKNVIDAGDTDAVRRRKASIALGAAIAASGGRFS